MIRELRLGNWVRTYGMHSVPKGTEVQIHSSHFGIFELNPSTVEPILLTTEWLKKFGFENDPKESIIWIINPFKEKGRHIGLQNSKGKFKFQYNLFAPVYIEYVHQLQNLYFALIGEELRVKETVA